MPSLLPHDLCHGQSSLPAHGVTQSQTRLKRLSSSSSYEHRGACIFSNQNFVWIYAQEWDFWIIWQLYFQFLKEPSCCSPQQLHQFTFPSTTQEGSLFSTPSPTFFINRCFNDGYSDWYEVVLHCSFDLHFSNNQPHCISFYDPALKVVQHHLLILLSPLPRCIQVRRRNIGPPFPWRQASILRSFSVPLAANVNISLQNYCSWLATSLRFSRLEEGKAKRNTGKQNLSKIWSTLKQALSLNSVMGANTQSYCCFSPFDLV